MSKQATLNSVSPFFVVADLAKAVAFYETALGFQAVLKVPEDAPFFAILQRDGVRLLLKEIGPDTPPLPNASRHEWARWDALIMLDDPDALAQEFEGRAVTFHAPLTDTEDGLRAFEVKDRDGYVLCFARPL